MGVKVKICLEQAEKEYEKFTDAWGVQDSKAIMTGGKESSIPAEVRDIFISSVMIGALEISENGKVVKQILSEETKGISEVSYQNHLRMHTIRRIQALPEEDQSVAIAQECSGLNALQISELRSKDFSVLSSVATIISFT